MQHFDLIVIIIGVVLIVAGVILFITGKVVSQSNQIEAFGIKLHFNNPSLMLLVAGIGMVLVPRLLPAPDPLENLPPSAAGIPSIQQDPDSLDVSSANKSPPPSSQVDLTHGSISPGTLAQTTKADASNKMSDIAKQETNPAPVLSGAFDLIGYRINNVPQDLTGSMEIYPIDQSRYQWMVSLDSYNVYGMPEVYLYSGLLYQQNQQWLLRITSSNDLSWIDNGPVPAKVVRQGEKLTFEYLYSGSHIQLTWEED